MIPVAKVKGLEHKNYVGVPADLQKQAAEAPGEPEGLRDVALAVPCSGTREGGRAFVRGILWRLGPPGRCGRPLGPLHEVGEARGGVLGTRMYLDKKTRE